MRVAHIKRTFLARTETFVYSQLTHLSRDQVVILARDLQHTDQFPGLDVRAFADTGRTWRKRWADVNYRVLRRMSTHERQFFSSQVNSVSPQLFHAHYAVDAAYFLPMIDRFDVPLIVSCYGYDVSSFPKRYAGYGRRYLQPLVERCDLFLAMSEDMKRDLVDLGVDLRRIVIHHPNGIDPARYSFRERIAEPGEKVRLLCVGTFEERKGIEYLLEALARVKRHTRNFELRLVGDGPLRPRIVSKIESLSLQDHVQLIGFVDHARLGAELDASHLFCLPCVTGSNGDKEGIPTILVEAQASGLPVVSTRHAGIPELVLDGVTGYLVTERDIDGLAVRLLEMIEHPERWAGFGRAGRDQVCRHFNAEALARKLEGIYARVLS